MKILWLAWKEPRHPLSGGAEVVLWELAQRMVAEGHDVTVLTSNYTRDGIKTPANEIIDGVQLIRVGSNRYLHPTQALFSYLRHHRGRYDVVIETVNTAPYFASLFGGKGRRYLLYHQLAREVWHFETKPPVSHFGYHILEPVATRLLGRAPVQTVAISQSTKADLQRFGYRPEQVHVISQGILLQPLDDLKRVKKFAKPTLLSLGALRAMKRTLDQIEAFEKAKRSIPELQLKIAGGADGSGYSDRVLQRIKSSKFAQDIEYLGRVSAEKKLELMQRCHLIMVTSVKEGWGLIVSEANSQGTPAVVYDVDGLRDSVLNGGTGRVTKANPTALAKAIVDLLQDSKTYNRFRKAAWEWSKELTFDKSYADLKQIIGVTA